MAAAPVTAVTVAVMVVTITVLALTVAEAAALAVKVLLILVVHWHITCTIVHSHCSGRNSLSSEGQCLPDSDGVTVEVLRVQVVCF